MRWYRLASSLRREMLALRPQIAARAQAIYDAWDQNEDGLDDEYGGGGICDDIAMAISEVLASVPGVELGEYGHEGDDHAAVTAARGGERYLVDIPHSVYEAGGGYSWTKVPGVVFSPADVVIVAI